MRSLAIISLLALTAARAAAQECTPEPELALAAEALLESEEAPAPARLLEAVRHAGSDAPVVDALVIDDGDEQRRARFLARVARRRECALACGEARRGARWLVLAAPRAGRLSVIEPGALRVSLAQGWIEPHLHAQDAEGTLWQSPTRDGARVELPIDLIAPIRLQLVASGPSGPRPIAERVLGAGTEPLVVSSDRPIDERVASLRGSSDAGSLRANRLLERVASDHAARVCREGRVTHLAPEGDPRERLAMAGIRARHVGEVVARAEDASRAYAAFLRSPSHRAALTDRRFTDAGIGQEHDREGRTCLVILLAAWPRAVPY